MNPADIFLEVLGSKGIAAALVAAFAAAERLSAHDAEGARLSLLVIGRSLPPTLEWRGLADSLEAQFGSPDSATTAASKLSTTDRDRVQAQLASLNRRGSAIPGGWSEELEQEYEELMKQLRSGK